MSIPALPYFDKPPLLYFAHPVVGSAAGTPEEIEVVVQANLQRARRWLSFLFGVMPDAAFEMSWLNYIEILPEGQATRERGLRDDELNASRCDGIVLCGGELSSGMKREQAAVLQGCFDRGVKTLQIDLLSAGHEPPWTYDRASSARINLRGSHLHLTSNDDIRRHLEHYSQWLSL